MLSSRRPYIKKILKKMSKRAGYQAMPTSASAAYDVKGSRPMDWAFSAFDDDDSAPMLSARRASSPKSSKSKAKARKTSPVRDDDDEDYRRAIALSMAEQKAPRRTSKSPRGRAKATKPQRRLAEQPEMYTRYRKDASPVAARRGAPDYEAKNCAVGSIAAGIDGHDYIATQIKKGTKRWQACTFTDSAGSRRHGKHYKDCLTADLCELPVSSRRHGVISEYLDRPTESRSQILKRYGL